MLYRTLLKLKERDGLTDRITEEQYDELMDIKKEEETKGGK